MSLAEVVLPLFEPAVSAGFPSPADDFIESSLNLHDYLVRHPVATFFVRASGNSMINAGIHSGDLLVVDRSLNPVNESVVVAVVNGEMTVKRLVKHQGIYWLIPENPDFKPLKLTKAMAFSVWGVVTHVIHTL